MTPFAIQIYQRYRKGETVEQLAARLRIPAERIAQRIRAAERHMAGAGSARLSAPRR